jgi:hypothetical protein
MSTWSAVRRWAEPVARSSAGRRSAPEMTWAPHAPEARLRLDAVVGLLVVLVALWLFVAPGALGYSAFTPMGDDRWTFAGTWSDTLAGLALAAAMVVRLLRPGAASWCMAAVGAVGTWLLLAPLALRYGAASPAWPAIWNDVVAGGVVLFLAAAGAITARRPDTARSPDRAPTSRRRQRGLRSTRLPHRSRRDGEG